MWAIAVAISLAAGCLDNSITGVRPLTLTLTVEPAAAAVGDSITFRYAATGTDLFAITLDYGDGQTGSVPALGAGAVGLTGFLKHAYAEAATYVATGTATDNTGRSPGRSRSRSPADRRTEPHPEYFLRPVSRA